MNQYQTASAFLPQLEQLLAASNQPMQYPLFMSPQSQSRPKTSKPTSNYPNQPKTIDSRNSPSFDQIADPTKRIRHTQQTYTEAPFNPREMAHMARVFDKANLPRNLPAAGIDELRKNPFSPQGSPQDMAYDEGLTIPALKGFGSDEGNSFLTYLKKRAADQYKIQKRSYEAYQKMIEQLEQQEAEQELHQRFMMQLERQQRQYENVVQRQMSAQQIDPKVFQLYQMAQARKLKAMSQQMANGAKPGSQMNFKHEHEDLLTLAKQDKSLNLALNFPKHPAFHMNVIKAEQSLEEPNTSSTADLLQPKVEDSSDEEGFQYIKVEDTHEISSENSKDSAEEKISQKKKGQESKKKHSDQYWNDYSQILGKNLIQKSKEEPRIQNKWQRKAGGHIVEEENEIVLPKESEILGLKTDKKQRKPRKPKPAKPIDVPQHMEDDNNIDYENLMSVTITNDPAYVGTENPKNKFVMISKNTGTFYCGPKETRVGNRYQASVPEYPGRPYPGKRRNPKAIWRPEIVKEDELKVYFDELRKIFSCELINEEHALRLLKRKKYRREKVAVNIGKSKKFYAKVLVVHNPEDGVVGEEKL